MFARSTLIVGTFLLLLPSVATRAQDPTKEQRLAENAWEIMRGAEVIDLFYLDPTGPKVFVGEWNYRCQFTSKGEITRKQVIEALQEGVKKAGKERKGKFEPQFGVRATSGGTTVEMVIDFDLGEIRLFVGKEKYVLRTSDSPKSFLAKLFVI